MAYTQQQLDTLQAAIAQGVLEVNYGDKKVTYRSLKEMREIEYSMKQDLGLLKSNSGRRFAQFSKGV